MERRRMIRQQQNIWETLINNPFDATTYAIEQDFMRVPQHCER